MLEGKFIVTKGNYDGKIKIDDILEFTNGVTPGVRGSYKTVEEYNEQCNSQIKQLALTKEDLRDGDYAIIRDGIENIVSIKFNRLLDTRGKFFLLRYYSNESLENSEDSKFDIMKVTRKGQVLFERQEKSAQQLEKESIIAEMEKLKERLDKLEVEKKEGK